MRTNYSNSPNKLTRALTASKMMLMAILLLVFTQVNSVSAQVTITAPSLAVTACTTFPTNASVLGDIVITETAAGDISTFGTLILSAPANFEFTAAGSASFTGTDITSANAVLTNASTITLTIAGSGAGAIDAITLNGIQVIGITAATGASDVTRTGGTSVINGNANAAVHATLISTATPTLSSSLTPAAICSGTIFTYSPTSGTQGSTFVWARAAVTNISNAAANGTGNINETLVNTSTSPVNVTYVYTVSANGCVNPTTFSVVVSVNPLPTLSSTLSPTAICSGTPFNYNPSSLTSGATFSWTRATVTGISNTLGSGTGNPNEVLTNTTTAPVNVTYIYTVSANGCTNSSTSSVVVTVNPGTSAPVAIAASNFTCTSFNANWNSVSGATTYFLDVSTDATFSTFVVGYSNLNVGNVTTYNITGLTINTTYYYRVRADNGCGTSLSSNTITSSTSAPNPPAANAATNISCTSADANWSAPAGATTYYLDVSTDPTFAPGTFLSGYNNLNVGNVLTINITGLTTNTIYYYRVKSSNGCGTSTNSTPTTFTTISGTVVTAPVAIAASNLTCISFDANWNTVSGATTYFLDVSTDAAFTTFVAGYSNLNIGNVTTYNVTGLTSNTTYYYRVRADNGCSTSSNSNTITSTTGSGAANLSSSLSPPAICSGSIFTYTPTSNALGATFAWTVSQSGVSGATAGSGSPSETLTATGFNAGTATYAITVTANGCSNPTPYNVVVTVNTFSIAPGAIYESQNPISTGDSTVLMTNGSLGTGASYKWYTGSCGGTLVATGDTLSFFPAVTTTYFVRAEGTCNTTACATVTIVVSPAVWPGDANNDSLVNNTDLLTIGLHYSQTGTPRSSISNSWLGYLSADWGTLQTNGQDIKHGDCNGDGTIDDNDTLAINLNFNLTHAIVAPPLTYYNEMRTTPDMYFVISSSSYNAGDWVDVELWLGESVTPVSDLYGISFNINYDGSLVQPGTDEIIYPASWLGTPGTDVLKIGKTDALANTAYGAITRTDHVNASGFGKVASFKFQVKTSLTSIETMNFSISGYAANDALGIAKVLSTGTDSIIVNGTNTGIKTAKTVSALTISPNPFSSYTTITFNKNLINANVKITDVLGKEVKNINFSGKQLIVEKGELNTGIYFISVVSEKELIANERIVIR